MTLFTIKAYSLKSFGVKSEVGWLNIRDPELKRKFASMIDTGELKQFDSIECAYDTKTKELLSFEKASKYEGSKPDIRPASELTSLDQVINDRIQTVSKIHDKLLSLGYFGFKDENAKERLLVHLSIMLEDE